MNHHTQDPLCPLCEEKIKTGHPRIQELWPKIKAQFPDCHVSWVFRNQEMQEFFFSTGKTKAHFPNSAHNATEDGEPRARALDLFQIRQDQVSSWNQDYFKGVWAFCELEQMPLIWGGIFKSIGDSDHFQLVKEVV